MKMVIGFIPMVCFLIGINQKDTDKKIKWFVLAIFWLLSIRLN